MAKSVSASGLEVATIVAISSPPGPGQRAVLRLSGPEARDLVLRRLELDEGLETDTRGVYSGNLDDDLGGMPCMWFWMPGPHSFTREDVCELHVPGSPPLVQSALDAFLVDGARLAQPGEFTRRAFENGRIDLTEAEGVLGLIEAADLSAARSAAQLLLGGLSKRIEELRTSLENLRALAEASLDFDSTETGHVETDALQKQAALIGDALAEALTWEQRRRAALGLPRVVFAGRPNAGKSSLFNLLSGVGNALVSAMAGSTRDGKSTTWKVGEVEVELHDAPGFEFAAQGRRDHAEGDDPDAKAQVLATESRRGADVILWCLSAVDLEGGAVELLDDRQLLPQETTVISVITKSDLASCTHPNLPSAVSVSVNADPQATTAAIEIEVARALGLESSKLQPASRVTQAANLGRELSARHRAALARGLEALSEARADLAAGIPLDLVAETLRSATDELDEICGRTTPEDLLDRIFAGFCLGK